jgi:hypothetical protein
MLAEFEPAGKPAGESGVNAYASEVLEREVKYEAPDYCGLEVLFLPHGQLWPQSPP